VHAAALAGGAALPAAVDAAVLAAAASVTRPGAR
jgi:sugar/nucleoside kinase (ribokinase family)